jgi:superfamily I DNA/RNA helicase
VQDLSNVELRFLRSLVPEGPDDLFMVGDPYQRIYARRLNFGAVGISVRGRRSRKLRINYRTSEEIKRAALSTVKSLTPDDFEGEGSGETLDGYLSLFHGQRPSYQVYQHRKDELQALLDAVKLHHEAGVTYSGMAIGVRLKASMDPFRDALHRAGIPYSDKISKKRNDKTGILLSTLHGLKGLEFKVVLLVDVTDATCPFRSVKFAYLSESQQRELVYAERSLLYVAMSRAVNFLYLSGTGVRSEMVRV